MRSAISSTAIDGARQQQVGDVRARNQKHAPDSYEQHDQRTTNIAR
ncbi:MAG: hypothetical protein WKF84_09610 [Pyrinomonadaceae bacterium]